MRNIYKSRNLGTEAPNTTTIEVLVQQKAEIVINFSDVSSWNVLAVTGLFTLFSTVIFIIVYEVGRRNPIVSELFDKRRKKHPQRTPPPLRKDRYFQWLFLETDISFFQYSDIRSETEESKEEIRSEESDHDTATYDTGHLFSSFSERIKKRRSQPQNNQDHVITNKIRTDFVCVNGRHIPPQFAEMAISGHLTETQLSACEKIVINSIAESSKNSSNSLLSKASNSTHGNDEVIIDCEHCKGRVKRRSSLYDRTSQLKSMIEKGRYDFSVADILLLQSVGMDQFVFIRFLRFCLDVTFYPFILACVTLIPTYYTNPYEGEVSQSVDTPSVVTDGYFRITMNRLEKGSPRLYICFIYALLYRIFLLYRLWMEWNCFYTARCEFLANGDSEMIITQHGIRGAQVPIKEQIRQFRHSVMVQSLPRALRGDKELFDFFNQVFPGQVKRVELILTCPLLRKLIAKRRSYIESYEKIFAKHHYAQERYKAAMGKRSVVSKICLNKEPVEPMIKIENAKFPALTYYLNEIRSLNILANNERLRLEQQRSKAMIKSMNLSNHIHRLRSLIAPTLVDEFASGTAFVEFNNLATVQSAIQCNITGSRNGLVIESAPDPRELKWDNVAVDRELLRVRYLVSNFLLLAGTLFWSPLVTLVTSYSDVDLLSLYLPSWMIPQPNTFIHAFMQGYLPVLFLEALMILLVMTLQKIARHYIRFKTESDMDCFIFLWHFGYRLANIFIVIISGSLKEVLYAIETNIGDFVIMVTQGFSYSSQFFLDNVIFAAGNGNFWELAQIVRIIKCVFIYKFVKTGATSKRDLKKLTRADRLHWGECLPEFVFTLMVAIMYCTSAPIILGACALCFFLASKVYLHQALYVYSPKYESGGMFMYYLNRATFITLYTTNVMFAALLWMKGAEYLGMIFLLFATGGTIIIDLRIKNRFIIPSSQLALVNARMLDEKAKENEEKEKRKIRVDNTVPVSSKPHTDTLEAFSFDPRFGDSVGLIPPSLYDTHRLEHKEQDFYIYTQPEMNISKWEIQPQTYR